MERLRDEAFGRYLIKRWEEAVFELDRRAAIPPELHNTNGDPLLLTTDHFEFEPASRADLESRLAGMEGVEADGSERDELVYVFMTPGNPMHASWETTLIGRAWFAGRALRLESNSVERADALRARVEAACGDLLRHRAREHADPMSPAVTAAAPDSAPEPPPPEAEQLFLEFKQRHYQDWIDQPLPALGGKTPARLPGLRREARRRRPAQGHGEPRAALCGRRRLRLLGDPEGAEARVGVRSHALRDSGGLRAIRPEGIQLSLSQGVKLLDFLPNA